MKLEIAAPVVLSLRPMIWEILDLATAALEGRRFMVKNHPAVNGIYDYEARPRPSWTIPKVAWLLREREREIDLLNDETRKNALAGWAGASWSYM